MTQRVIRYDRIDLRLTLSNPLAEANAPTAAAVVVPREETEPVDHDCLQTKLTNAALSIGITRSDVIVQLVAG